MASRRRVCGESAKPVDKEKNLELAAEASSQGSAGAPEAMKKPEEACSDHRRRQARIQRDPEVGAPAKLRQGPRHGGCFCGQQKMV